MITDKQKEEIFLRIAPFELYYCDDIVLKHIHDNAIRLLSNDFENESLFVESVNGLLKLNNILFFNAVSKTQLTKIDFIDYVSNQYNVFKENIEGKGLIEWLNHTKKIIFDKESNRYPKEVSMANKSAFIKWYDETLKNITNYAEGKKGSNITSLSLDGYALRLFYEGKKITRINAKDYLEETIWSSHNKLYNEFIKWSNRNDRKANPESKIKLKNKIELFENVIKELPEDKKTLAIDELEILNSFNSLYQ